MAKFRRRSPKQRANDRRLGLMARGRKTNKRRSRSTSVRRRRFSRRSVTRYVRRRGGARRIGGGIVSTIRPMATGIGMGQIAETVASQVGGGQFAQFAGYGGAYLGGGLKGVAGKVIYDAILGRGNILGGFGLGSNSGGGGL